MSFRGQGLRGLSSVSAKVQAEERLQSFEKKASRGGTPTASGLYPAHIPQTFPIRLENVVPVGHHFGKNLRANIEKTKSLLAFGPVY